MAQSRYQHTISLNEQEEELVKGIRDLQGVYIKDIFNRGLEYYAPSVPKELIEKVKNSC